MIVAGHISVGYDAVHDRKVARRSSADRVASSSRVLGGNSLATGCSCRRWCVRRTIEDVDSGSVDVLEDVVCQFVVSVAGFKVVLTPLADRIGHVGGERFPGVNVELGRQIGRDICKTRLMRKR